MYAEGFREHGAQQDIWAQDEVTGEWKRLHKKELYVLYSSPNIIRVIKLKILRQARHVARLGERIGACWALVGKPDGRSPLGRPRRRWEDNIKVDLREVGCGEHRLDRSGSGQGQMAGSCEYGDEHSGSIKCVAFLE